MPTFGMSAFLKLLCQNDRPQRSALRSRLFGSDGGGYDFHRSLRLRVHRYIVGGEPMEDVLASTLEIVREPEQRSARGGLEQIEVWRSEHPGPVMAYPTATYESPNGLFRVNFNPDFGLDIGGQGVAVHVWNTARPTLVPRMVYAALSLFPLIYTEIDGAPEDLGVLSLPDRQLYRLSEAGRLATLGAGVAARIEDLMRDISEKPGQPSPDDQPSDRTA
jgi:hypothetical protein